MTAMIEPPTGCMEIPGYILVVFPGKLWLTQAGEVTEVWSERGIWPTEADAKIALEKFQRDIDGREFK